MEQMQQYLSLMINLLDYLVEEAEEVQVAEMQVSNIADNLLVLEDHMLEMMLA